MKSLYYFIAGIASSLSFGWPTRMRYPFPFPVRAIGNDWENVGRDLAVAIKLHQKSILAGGSLVAPVLESSRTPSTLRFSAPELLASTSPKSSSGRSLIKKLEESK